jgi:hypothetical protein
VADVLDVLLVGFLGPYLGSERTLTSHLPVIRINNEYWATWSENWTLNRGMERVAADDLHIFPVAGGHLIRPGETVWLAGGGLQSNLKKRRAFLQIYDEFQTEPWWPYENSFAMSVGPRPELRRLSTRIFEAAKADLELGLSDLRNRGSLDPLEPAFEVLRDINTQDRRTQLIVTAFYLRECRRHSLFEATVRVAVTLGGFDDREGFVRQVDLYETWLMRHRISDPVSRELSRPDPARETKASAWLGRAGLPRAPFESIEKSAVSGWS